ncbi:FAD-dependent monooxygenase [Nonomuraea sp. NBC_01738]|uniref:FAD-dependent monooxygenase n=1 Tax=Nonomuraea sp. NBC_01738 TaxID=2976003 RepID=UPI002E1356DF|nr:FAD-dependent monooxygenase [Nonomuraea sp. NBC_01738]
MTNFLISGASIAGTTTAYWLRRHGFDVTVVERAPSIREGGYKVDIRGAALDVVERMGILDEVRARRTGMTTATYYDGKGKKVAAIDADLFGGREGPDEEIMRGDLNEILYELTRHDTEYLFDDSITAIAEDGTVTFEKAAPRRFDVVIGADGAHSNTRRLVFGDESKFARHLGAYISISTVPNHLGLEREEAVHAAPGRTANVYSTRQDGTAKALFIWSGPEAPYDHRDVAGQKAMLTETMAGAGWVVPELLMSVRAADDFYFDSVSQIHMDSWSSGRIVLVGDAGYCASPASGQGTSLALVGAYVLALELARADGDLAAAFAAYEREMRPFVAANQALGPANLRGMVLPSRFMVWFQLTMMKLLPHLPGKDRTIERITGPIREAASAITLKPVE